MTRVGKIVKVEEREGCLTDGMVSLVWSQVASVVESQNGSVSDDSGGKLLNSHPGAELRLRQQEYRHDDGDESRIVRVRGRSDGRAACCGTPKQECHRRLWVTVVRRVLIFVSKTTLTNCVPAVSELLCQ